MIDIQQDPDAAAKLEAEFTSHFLNCVLSGDQESWTDLLTSLKQVSAQFKGTPRQPENLCSVVHLLLKLTTEMMKQKRPNVARVVGARESAPRLIELLAAHETEHKGAMAFADLQRALEFKTMQNLSMLLAYLEDNEIVRRTKQGRNTWVELLPAGRHYAVKQGWLMPLKIEIPPQRYFGPQSKISAPIRRGDL